LILEPNEHEPIFLVDENNLTLLPHPLSTCTIVLFISLNIEGKEGDVLLAENIVQLFFYKIERDNAITAKQNGQVTTSPQRRTVRAMASPIP
jgi:hypothetical protein